MAFGIRVGDLVFAKCSEDVWYNVKILEVHSDHLYVEYVDYGHRDEVSLRDVVKHPKDIPNGDLIDEHVTSPMQSVKKRDF